MSRHPPISSPVQPLHPLPLFCPAEPVRFVSWRAVGVGLSSNHDPGCVLTAVCLLRVGEADFTPSPRPLSSRAKTYQRIRSA